jgi:hypothetical protein
MALCSAAKLHSTKLWFGRVAKRDTGIVNYPNQKIRERPLTNHYDDQILMVGEDLYEVQSCITPRCWLRIVMCFAISYAGFPTLVNEDAGIQLIVARFLLGCVWFGNGMQHNEAKQFAKVVVAWHGSAEDNSIVGARWRYRYSEAGYW